MVHLKVALVGCGRIGQRHLQALVHCSTIDLTATVDSDPEKAAAAAVPFDAASYQDLESLVSHHPDLDGVIIATPSGTHRSLVEGAIAQGLHVLVERPMALTAADARLMIERAARAGKVLMVTQLNRLLPTVNFALDTFRQGRIGRLIEGGVSLRWSRSQSFYDSKEWRGTRNMDGGVLFNQAIQPLDQLLQFTGPIDEVFAYAGTQTHAMECEDTVAAVLKAHNGALLTVNATTSVCDSDLEERLVVLGETGSIVLGPTLQQVEYWRVAEDDEDQIKQGINGRPVRPGWQTHLDALTDFHAAVTSTHRGRLSADSTMHVIEVIEALIGSAAQGRAVGLAAE